MIVNNALDKFQVDVGSTTATNGKYIVNDINISINSSNNSDFYDNSDDGFIIDNIYLKSINNTIDLDNIMVSDVHV